MSFEKNLLDFIATNYRNSGHSIFSPSGSGMWLHCSGSLIPNLLAPDAAGLEAAEGTVAHSMGEEWLTSGERPDHRIGDQVEIREGDQVFEIEVDRSMLDYVSEYVDWCANLPGKHYVEQRVYFSRLTPIPKQGGTADHFVCEPGVLTITDLKYGKGVQVYAAIDHSDPRSLIERDGETVVNGNSQAMLYALGVVFKYDKIYDFQRIVIRIAQPRLDHFDVWETTKVELMRFARFVEKRAAEAWRLNAPRRPSESACRWCRVKQTCPAFVSLVDSIADDCFSDLDGELQVDRVNSVVRSLDSGTFDPILPVPLDLSTNHLAKVLPFRSIIETWFAAVEHELEGRALAGEKVISHKLVEARTNRVFKSERQAIERLCEAGFSEFELYSLKFISPAQAEELLRTIGMKKKEAVEFLSTVVVKPPGKATLVSESDPRPEYVDVADEVFEDL